MPEPTLEQKLAEALGNLGSNPAARVYWSSLAVKLIEKLIKAEIAKHYAPLVEIPTVVPEVKFHWKCPSCQMISSASAEEGEQVCGSCGKMVHLMCGDF